MSFCPQHLRIVACAGDFTLWHYRTDDNRGTLLSDDYFADATASGTLRKGDMLIIEHAHQNDEAGHADDVNLSLYAIAGADKSQSADDGKKPLS